ncbi:MAG: N-acetyl sugar amidotransferase [Bdellovibrionales bacterium]|nr:N-acetyl sugar amidotransferase [Bdellovibrionales bacterium]
MDTTDEQIDFDVAGVCDHCRGFYRDILPNWHTDERGRKALEQVADEIRQAGRGRDFDCILGISGGIDSSYLAYIAKERMGLRPLIFHVDAGWNSQQAVNNIEVLINHLGLDLYTEVINWQEMRDLQLAFFKAGVAHLDTPQDHAFFATMYNFAAKYRIKYILTGANYATECVKNPIAWHYHASDLRQIRDIHRQFGTVPLRTFPLANILRYKVQYRFLKGVRVVKPLNYVPYVKDEAMQFLAERFAWQPYPQKHFESRFTKFYEGFWLPTKFGYDKRKVQFSSLILSGQMTRDEALRRLAEPPYDEATIHHDFEYVATKLGISGTELKSYLDAPNKSYRDYRSQIELFNLGVKVLRSLGVERRVIR